MLREGVCMALSEPIASAKGAQAVKHQIRLLKRGPVCPYRPPHKLPSETVHLFKIFARGQTFAVVLGLRPGQSREMYTNAENLFLKEQHAQGGFQDWLEGGMVIDDWLEALLSSDVRMYALVLDGTRAD